MKESVFTFSKVTILIDYLFIYLNHTEVRDKINDPKKTYVYEIYVFLSRMYIL